MSKIYVEIEATPVDGGETVGTVITKGDPFPFHLFDEDRPYSLRIRQVSEADWSQWGPETRGFPCKRTGLTEWEGAEAPDEAHVGDAWTDSKGIRRILTSGGWL